MQERRDEPVVVTTPPAGGASLIAPPPPPPPPRPPASRTRKFFIRGLAILLPTVLTIWILVAAYGFVQANIAGPINAMVRESVLYGSEWSGRPFPAVDDASVAEFQADVQKDPALLRSYRSAVRRGEGEAWLERAARRRELSLAWADYGIVFDLIGLIVAIVGIYAAGVLLGSYIGRRLYQRGEQFIARLPLVRTVYPAVKQVTDFLFGGEEKLQFNRVVAVEYPRRGIWSVGMVTGDTMRSIQDRAGVECLTVFIPSSPTPFTGYVITVPASETIELPINIEDALKFAVSGGVVIPPNQVIDRSELTG